ncbi:UNVERIFIED_CONTAM: hypothetical protein HDU68_007002 [Siphonaria sp. JEL0065]|nr:hypothetical protein HDU68_007002 [Siphonaria sp. JEL0065]
MDFVFCDPPAGAAAVTYDEALQKLADFYVISDIPGALNEAVSMSRPTWSQFKKQNKLGFLNGILTYAPDSLKEEYVAKFYWTFGSSTLPKPDTDEERGCLNLLYARFIEPFKQHGKSGSSNASAHESTPSTPGGPLTALDLNAVDPTHANFRSALHKRDKVCLFCWGNEALDAAHLIAQKPSASPSLIIPDLLHRASLDSVYRVQNGILLCAVCHRRFDDLRRYIDVVDNRLVAKVVNLTNDIQNEDYLDAVGAINALRSFKLTKPAFAGRSVVDASNQLLVYVADGDTTKHPNLTALAFHKAACLIWKMAGAADDNEDDDIDHEGSVDSLLEKVGDRLRHFATEYERSNLTLGGLDDVQ